MESQSKCFKHAKYPLADRFILTTLAEFYGHMQRNGVQDPVEIKDKYRNPNPLKFFKVYSDHDILLTHYMLNEGLIAGVIKIQRPLLIKGSITQKGLQYLMMEELMKL